jgi:hypothetical protein
VTHGNGGEKTGEANGHTEMMRDRRTVPIKLQNLKLNKGVEKGAGGAGDPPGDDGKDRDKCQCEEDYSNEEDEDTIAARMASNLVADICDQLAIVSVDDNGPAISTPNQDPSPQLPTIMGRKIAMLPRTRGGIPRERSWLTDQMLPETERSGADRPVFIHVDNSTYEENFESRDWSSFELVSMSQPDNVQEAVLQRLMSLNEEEDEDEEVVDEEGGSGSDGAPGGGCSSNSK